MYTITEYGLEKLMEKVNKLNKKSSNSITVDIINTKMVTDKIDGMLVNVKVFEIELTEERQLLGNWEILAVKKLLEKSVLFFPVAGNYVPEKYHNNEMNCEHCGYSRNRNCVIVLKNVNTGELKQVGKSCLKEFCGLSLSESLYRFEELPKIVEEIEDGFYSNSSFSQRYIDVKSYINFVYDSIVKYGYVKFDAHNQKPFDRDNWENNFTRDNALMMYRQQENPVNDIAGKIIDYYKSTKQNNDFFENVCSLISEDYIPFKYLNMVTFIPYFYIKGLEQQEKDRQKAEQRKNLVNEYAVSVGEKFTGTVKLNNIYAYETQFGITRIYSFLDEQNRTIVWKTGNFIEIEKGESCIISGKCKDNNEYNGIRQTVLTRCKVTK